jgi:hypothetical protein
MPTEVPKFGTPSISNGQVNAITKVGNTIVAGGTFSTVAGQARSRIVAFDATTYALTSFNPVLDGAVNSIIPGPTAGTVFVGGAFKNVNGAVRRGVVLLDLATGAQVSAFNPKVVNGTVNDLVLRGNQLYLGGTFTKVRGLVRQGLARVNATTGVVDANFVVNLAEHHNTSGSGAQAAVGATAIDVTPDNTSMVVVGNFRTANGLPRVQAAMIDVAASPAAVRADWNTTRFEPLCFYWAFDTYMRGVSMSPDGSFFVINTTGGANGGTLCDSASRWETTASGSDVQPTWANFAGGDTFFGVTVTNNAVYVGGHMRWLNNPNGGDYASYGSVARPGLGALDPVSGRPLDWNPGRNPRGVGAFAMFATSDGLWVGSDTNFIGNRQYRRERIAFFPYAGGVAQVPQTTQSLPAKLWVGANDPGTTDVLYRVNAGGTTVAAVDNGPDWSDDSATDSAYRNSGSNAASWGPGANRGPNLPDSAPTALFDDERWDPSGGTEMAWAFPVPSGTPVQVRLFFADRYSGTSTPGTRVFDVTVDGVLAIDNLDISGSVGPNTGMMRTVDIVSDGTVDIDLTHYIENPAISGIELVRTDVTPVPPGPGTLSTSDFDGTSATGLTEVDAAGIDWGTVRGAFSVGGKLYYGMTDAKLHVASFDGTTIGTSSIVQPYHDAYWMNISTGSGQTFDGVEPTLYAQMSSVTGMAYDRGKLLYTRTGDNALRARWFSPDSGIMDETTTSIPSSVSFDDAGGMFVSGSWLYVVERSTGDLRRVAFDGSSVTGAWEIVDGPSTSGNDWRNKALFLGPQ